MNPLYFVGTPDWRSAMLSLAFTAPWLFLLTRGWLKRFWVWLFIVAGAVLFPLSLAWFQAPIERALDILWLNPWIDLLPTQAVQRGWWLWLPYIILSGLVQELAKFGLSVAGIALARSRQVTQARRVADVPAPTIWAKMEHSLLPRQAGLAVGAAVGAGYGGMEVFRVLNLIFASGFPRETVCLWGTTVFLGFLERFFVAMFHIGAASISAYGYVTGRLWRYLLLAIGLHSLMNFSVPLNRTGLLSVVGVEIWIASVAVATMVAALWIRARWGLEIEGGV